MRRKTAHHKLRSENMLDLARLMSVARCDYKFDHRSIEMWKSENKSKFCFLLPASGFLIYLQ
jgi:hypothetical protein